ncbi:MAG: hypothetical protein WBC50_09490 [Dehalococcoidales bacterium]
MTTYKVMETGKYDDAIFYRVDCACSSDRCGLHMELSYEKDINELSLYLYKNLSFRSYNSSRIVSAWLRIKGALKILFTGYIEVNEDLLIEGGEHIDNFIKALEEGREKMLERKKQLSK